jgi:LDH2 family malate/lactate/ureidoglycolate dehydrogenase
LSVEIPLGVAHEFVTSLFEAAGLQPDKASTVAELLLEADVMGHTTHGVALAPRYLKELSNGSMSADGVPEVLVDRGATVVWDGRRLPGVWVTVEAIELALTRVPKFGTFTIVVRNNHHIGCLAAYLQRATDHGYMILIASSDPSQRTVAPWGGKTPVMTPNPIAVGIPTAGDPILVDVSASITTNNMVARVVRKGGRLPGKWVIDEGGIPTDDPEPALGGRNGSIMLAGGTDHGHKGFGWALTVEALTQGLAGFGRADSPRSWGSGVFLQVIDPDAFAGKESFTRQTTELVELCHASDPRPGFEEVRMPGEKALRLKREALRSGVSLDKDVARELQLAGSELGVRVPRELAVANASA